MRYFILKITLWLACFLCIFYSIQNSRFGTIFLPNRDVYKLVDNISNQYLSSEILLIGDSVCAQFCNYIKSEKVTCMCSNQAYEVVGNYLILKELLNNNSKFEKVFLVINPGSLRYSLDQVYTYNYFVLPFKPLSVYLETETRNRLDKIYTAHWLEPRYWFSNRNFDSIKTDLQFKPPFEISNQNKFYLKKIRELADSNGFSFQMVLPPLPNSQFEKLVSNFSLTDREEFGYYFDSGTYYQDKFSSDGIHIDEPNWYIETEYFHNYKNHFFND